MKKIFLSVLVMIFAFGAFSAPVTQQEAINLATNYLKFEANGTKSKFDVSNVSAIKLNNLTTYYIVNFKDGGFVIISADDRVEPILGYSVTNSIPQEITNESVKSWLGQYSNQIEYAVKNNLKDEAFSKKWNDLRNSNFVRGTKAVTPLLTTTWDQGQYYNALTPVPGSTGTYTGCVATAMAQVMKFWNYPATGNGSNTYKHTTYNTLTADYSDSYDWASMTNNVTSSNPAVAELMSEAGVSVNMDYGTDASGAFSVDVPYALVNYFQYNAATCHQIELANYLPADWIAILEAELNAGRPIYYSGSGAGGGHAFVCDGYNATNQMHFNFGWSGFADGYFAIGAINAGGTQFNATNAAVIGIQPGDEDQGYLWVQKCAGFPLTSTYPGYISAVDNNVAWATGRDGSGGGADYKVYTKTTDGGLTWTSGTFTTYGTSYAMIFGLSATEAYIPVCGTGATGNRLIKTTDGGTTWTSVLQGTTASSFFNIVHFFDATNGLVMGDPDTEFEIYTTTDGGATWPRVAGANIPNPISGEYGITGLYNAVGNTIWFSTNKGRIFKSTDKGINWTVAVVKTGLGANSTNIELAFDDNALVGLANVNIVNSGGTSVGIELYKTSDGGLTWTLFTPVGNYYKSGLSAVPGMLNTFVSVGADATTPLEGVSYSVDGGTTWIDYAPMYSSGQIVSVKMVSASKGYAGSFGTTINTGTNPSSVTHGGAWVFGDGNANEFTANMNSASEVTCQGAAQNISTTYFGEGTPSVYTWNFGTDATPPTATGIGPHAVTYSSAGEKEVSLEITANGATHSYIDYLTVSTLPAAAGVITGNATPNQGTTGAYSIASVANADSYEWTLPSFATGTSTTPSINVTFISVGTGDIIVSGVNQCGNGVSSSLTIDALVYIFTNQEKTISLYPNPATDFISITNAQNSVVNIYNILGTKVNSINISDNNYQINVSDFKSGNYVVEVILNGEKVSKVVTIK